MTSKNGIINGPRHSETRILGWRSRASQLFSGLAMPPKCAVRSVAATTAASAASADRGILIPFHCAPNNKG